MGYKRNKLLRSITGNLIFQSGSTSMENVIGLFDSNRAAQDFYKGLLSLGFDYKNLQDLDKLNNITNHPAIDLGDTDAKIAFQITSVSDREKIKSTIEKFIQHKLYEKYDRLIMLIIGNKQASCTTNFDTQDKFSFNKQTDIWDDNYLIKEIDKLDTQTLEKIEQYLQEELEEYKFPERLFDEDIKQCIEILTRDFGNSEVIDSLIGKRGDNFIERKNEINNISLQFFKDKMRGHITQYNKAINEFLSLPINKAIEKDYFSVAKAINNYYTDNKNKFISFEEMFKEIFTFLNTYDDEISGLNTKLKILLHNMYFNCDIGEQPK